MRTAKASPAVTVPRPSDRVLERLTRLHPKLIDLSLGRVQRLLDALGNPEARLPPVVHFAGTNGKGSTIAFLRAMAEAAGLRVHVYTSPHLVDFAERIVCAGRVIDDDALAALLGECETANDGAPITFFEITTAAAFLAFSRIAADIALIETGLGGRFDATNVIARPALTAITPISIDHVGFLGHTLAEIAFEKAGILKPAVPCLVAPQPAAPRRVIAERAAALGVRLTRWPDDWAAAGDDGGMVLRDGGAQIALPGPALRGGHQIVNAGLAALCFRRIGSGGEDAIAAGLRAAVWPGRLQDISAGALGRSLGDGWQLWLDGGHNAGAAEALAAMLAGWDKRPLYLVLGMVAGKDVAGYLRPLARHVAAIRSVAIPGAPASLSAADTARAAQRAGIAAMPAPSVAAAVAAIGRAHAAPGRILICGSLYLAGAVLAALQDGVAAPGTDAI
jgi:dihydrofolate synthase / folylpolyglutamate synthase